MTLSNKKSSATHTLPVAHCYPNHLEQFPQELKNILQRHYMVMNPELRMVLCRSLILLRNKGLLSPTSLLELFFLLFRCKDKLLRKTLYSHIVTDIRNVNAKHKNNKVNSTLQNFMYTMLNDSNLVAAKKSLDVMVELYKKNIWKDAKTVNVVASACLSDLSKISVTALKFLLDKDENDGDSDSESEDDGPTVKQLLLANRVRKKTKKGENKLKKALTKAKKKKKDLKSTTFSALYLINDSQGFSEKLFKKLESSNERFEVRLMMMDVLARLIGVHQLFLFNFYPFLQKYLQPHQKEVTKMLTFYAQACHELVPPEVVEPGLRAIVNNFVTERNSSEVIAVGINAVKEVCNRCPLVMSEELLRDLAAYKKSKNKSVFNASRSLIQQFRTLNPALLHKKDRGQMTAEEKNVRPSEYGEMLSKDYVPGAQFLDVNTEKENGETTDGKVMNNENEESDEQWSDDMTDSEDDDVIDQPEENKVPEDIAGSDPSEEDVEIKASRISQTKIFTNEDFKKIRLTKIVQQVNPKAGKKRKREEENKEPSERKDLLSVDDIEQIYGKKRRSSKEERLASAKAGRGDIKRTFQKNRCNEFTSTTNKEKRKTKAYMMVKHKVKGKNKRSFRDKQIALRDSLLKKKRKTKF
ncbi:protein SDA1 homolog isoform X2 [Dendronephthya gigantea]|uniref:protein SDA1 homolog isoform X2 n=1 Tax=Dendronephthya gigantea TaxID=151771 RepID=UPI00106D4591|nr:protein SDA1 homolog isoform X2 [Dendronephthya gigantea]